MKFRGLRRALKLVVELPSALAKLPMVEEQNAFLLHEVRRLDEQLRSLNAGNYLEPADRAQTRGSFDYQWQEMPEGAALPSDPEFMRGIQELVCTMTGKPREWFAGKRVVDVGCGLGRFTFAMLAMGANVTACDQSEWGLTRTRELAAPYAERLETRQIDLLEWDGREDFDMAFCFGVVHHTGNTYLALRNVARKVAEGGTIFLMVYGYPSVRGDFSELNSYEDLRQELRLNTLDERRAILLDRFGPELAHGYFDAVSPRINDLLTFEEIAECLGDMGFTDARRTIGGRNVHMTAVRGSA